MGCWNKTCGLSGLPIFAGDPVYVFVLQENSDKTDRCYSTAFWRPVLVPFYSEYNDYGAGENSSGVGLQTIMDGLSKRLIEKEQGENPYHDIPVKREGFDVEKFFNAVHESRLHIDGYQSDEQIDYVMFRKDVVDYILENNKREIYVGSGKGNTGWDNNYISVKFSDIMADVDKFIERNKTLVSGGKWFMESQMVKSRGDDSCLVDTYLFGYDSYRTSKIIYPLNIFAELLTTDIKTAKEFLIDYIKGCYLDSFMSATRKNWMPGGHEGSQSGVNPEYGVLIGSIQMGIDKDKKQREEDFDGDDE